jgi:ribosomal protein S28E/S33
VLERHDLGADRVINRYSVLSAARLSKTQVSLQVIFRPGGEGEERQRLVLVVRDGTRRTMFNQVDDGPVRVKDGVALKFGLRTPLLRKCE